MNQTTPDLAHAYDEGAKAHQPVMRDVLRSALSTAQDSEIERWRQNGARLLERAQAALISAQAAYSVDQAKLSADQTRRLQELSNELREERRTFEQTRQAQLRDLSEAVTTLINMRGAGDNFWSGE